MAWPPRAESALAPIQPATLIGRRFSPTASAGQAAWSSRAQKKAPAGKGRAVKGGNKKVEQPSQCIACQNWKRSNVKRVTFCGGQCCWQAYAAPWISLLGYGLVTLMMLAL